MGCSIGARIKHYTLCHPNANNSFFTVVDFTQSCPVIGAEFWVKTYRHVLILMTRGDHHPPVSSGLNRAVSYTNMTRQLCVFLFNHGLPKHLTHSSSFSHRQWHRRPSKSRCSHVCVRQAILSFLISLIYLMGVCVYHFSFHHFEATSLTLSQCFKILTLIL